MCTESLLCLSLQSFVLAQMLFGPRIQNSKQTSVAVDADIQYITLSAFWTLTTDESVLIITWNRRQKDVLGASFPAEMESWLTGMCPAIHHQASLAIRLDAISADTVRLQRGSSGLYTQSTATIWQPYKLGIIDVCIPCQPYGLSLWFRYNTQMSPHHMS